MPTISERLRSLFTSRKQDTQNGILRLGSSTFQAQTYTLPRIAASVYSNPTGYRCVELICNSLARPAWETYAPGTEDPKPSPLLEVLNAPAPRISGTQMQAMMAKDLTLTGRWAALKMQGVDGFGDKGPVTGLRRLSPYRLVVLGNQDDELVGFVYMDRQGVRLPILAEDVVYVHFPNPERYYDGIAPAVVAGLPAEIDSSAMRFNYDLLANDGALPGYISVAGLTPDQFQSWVGAWQAKEVPGKMRFLGGSGQASYVKVGQTNQELAYDKLRDYSQRDICMGFGVANVLLNPTDATFANMTEARSGFWQDTLMPVIALENDQLTLQLGADFGVAVGQKLDSIDELQESTDALVDRSIKLSGIQAVTVNEIREDLGLDPVAWGDEPIAPSAPMKAYPQGPVGAGGEPEAEAEPPSPPPPPAKPKPRAIEAPRIKRPVGIPDFEHRVRTYEQRMAFKMRSFFARQGRVIEARVRAGAGKSRAKALDTPSWWDGTRWDGELADDLSNVYSDTVSSFATDLVARLGSGTFNPNAAAIRQYIEAKVQKDSQFINETTVDEVRSLIADGANAGLSIADIADSIAGYFSGDDSQAAMRAERVARTEVIGASNYGLLEGARASGVATGKTWLTAGGGECGECGNLSGETVALDESFSNGDDQPPDHANCFIAGTIVAGPLVHATFARSYKGPLVTIRTASGDELTGTPNHPILTPKGWVGLGALREGEDVFRSSNAERMAQAVDPQHHQVPALIEEVRAPGAVTLLKVPGAAAHFHGDGLADRDVDVELADGSLYAHGEPSRSAFLKQISDGNLSWAGMTAALLLREGALMKVARGTDHATHAGMGGGGKDQALFGRQPSEAGSHPVTAVARFDTGSQQAATEDVTADAALVTQRLLALPGTVSLDQIVEVRNSDAECHVYNLSTQEGWYSANNLITANCRCTLLIVTTDASGDTVGSEEELGFRVPAVKSEPVVVHIHQAPASNPFALPGSVTVDGPALIRTVREAAYVKNDDGEIVGHREVEQRKRTERVTTFIKDENGEIVGHREFEQEN